jgi:hypothetical protein
MYAGALKFLPAKPCRALVDALKGAILGGEHTLCMLGQGDRVACGPLLSVVLQTLIMIGCG